MRVATLFTPLWSYGEAQSSHFTLFRWCAVQTHMEKQTVNKQRKWAYFRWHVMYKQCNPTTTRLQTKTMRRTDSEGSYRCTINNYKCQSFGAQSIDKLPYVHFFGGMCNPTSLQTKGLYPRAWSQGSRATQQRGQLLQEEDYFCK